MKCVVSANLIYAKSVDHKGELDRSCLVFPKAWCVFGWEVVKFCKVFAQLVVCDDASLRETIHTFADFNVNMAVVNKWEEIALINYFLRDDID